MFIVDIHSGVGFIPINSTSQFFLNFHYSFLFTWAKIVGYLIETLKARGRNDENGENGDQGTYHHGTKETNFGVWGFGDIIFFFAPFMFPLEFLRLYFFVTDLTITFLLSFTASALSLAVRSLVLC